MCGICGLYSPTRPPPADLVDAMRARLRHRGPDEGSTDAFGPCVLGHQRLRVLDPELGYQPVANETGDVVAVFNGELYNFAQLREELAARGHEVRGRGDTPLIPHLYEEYGMQFVERLEGMFAIALWDRPRKRLVLARDRLGKKPLVWTRLPDGTFAFASELKAFHALPDFRAEPDLTALDAYLALQYVPGPRTGMRGVRRHARAVAERWSTRHEEIVLEPDAAATLPRLAAAFDEPLGDEAALPLFLICEAARRHVTVALVGDGGDESFAGYERYVAMGLADRVPGGIAGAGARLLRRLPRQERRSTTFRAARFLEAAATPRAER